MPTQAMAIQAAAIFRAFDTEGDMAVRSDDSA
jgi:hypothetical protein